MNMFTVTALNESPPLSLQTQCPATQQEFFGSSSDTAALALALHLAQLLCEDARPYWLWVQDSGSIRLTGRPFIHGLPPVLQKGLVHIAAPKPEDALFALEEGLRCADFGFVIGELAGDPKALDFTASRRLSVASERHGVPFYLIRNDGYANLSAARRRWRVAPYPSQTAAWNLRAPGQPRWHAEMFRARGLPPGEWIVSKANEWQSYNGARDGQSSTAYPLDMAASTLNQPLAEQRAA